MIGNLASFRDPTFTRNVVQTIIEMCSHNNYENISSFEWLITHVVFSLAQLKDDFFD